MSIVNGYQMEGCKMYKKRQRNLLQLGLVVGALGGAVAAYFYAPQNGDKTKAMIAKRLNNFTQTSILRTQSALIQIEQKLEDQ